MSCEIMISDEEEMPAGWLEWELRDKEVGTSLRIDVEVDEDLNFRQQDE